MRLEVTEQVLNHVSGSRAGIVGVYQRHDFASEKRAALNAWGEHVLAVVEGQATTVTAGDAQTRRFRASNKGAERSAQG